MSGAGAALATVRMAATPSQVMAVIADVAAYPAWISYVRAAEVLTSDDRGRPAIVRLGIDAGIFTDSCTFRYEWAADHDVSWRLTEGGVISAMDASYRVRADGETAVVDHRLALEVKLPGLGLFARKIERSIMESGLRQLRQRAERVDCVEGGVQPC